MILVTYHSETGNTRRVAEAIVRGLGAGCTLLPMEKASLQQPWELVFAGFPVHRFGPSRAAKTFLEQLPEGQPVALFVTHAMDPDSHDPDLAAMLQNVLTRCQKAVKRGTLLGFYHCRGELSEAACRMLAESGIPQLARFAEQRPETLGMPTAEALDAAARMAAATEHRFRTTPSQKS